MSKTTNCEDPRLRADGAWGTYRYEFPDVDDYDRGVEAMGYDRFPDSFCALHDDWSARVWTKAVGAPPELPAFRVELGVFDRIHAAFVDTLPQMLDLLAKWLPIAESAQRMYLMSTAETALRLAFRAWHGHDLDDVCRICNPIAARARDERRARRPAKVVGDGSAN